MILYFSATGNTKYCAELLASRTNDKAVSLNGMMKNNLSVIDCEGEEALGIVAPTYDMDLAYAVAEFLERVELRNVSKDIYAYGVFTCGSVCGDCGETLKKILAAKDINLNAAFVVIMPDNYVPMFKQKSDKVKAAMLAKADETLNDITEDIKARKNIFKLTGRLPRFVMFFIRKFMMPSQRKVKSFSVNDSCVGCGTCARVCPMNIIEMKDNRPVWTKDNCACCLACLHRCPKQAINRGKSAKNGRYLNPNVKLEG